VILVALLVVRFSRTQDQKMRKAATGGYHDHDAARYGAGTASPLEGDVRTAGEPVPLAPSFVAPKRGRSRKQVGPATPETPSPPPSTPSPSALGKIHTSPEVVPAFDSGEAHRVRPPGAVPTVAMPEHRKAMPVPEFIPPEAAQPVVAPAPVPPLTPPPPVDPAGVEPASNQPVDHHAPGV
jgi:hypothetical protein